MTDPKPRLMQCFRTVFPDLTDAQIPTASQDTVPSWDSVASITLINVIEDEFGITIDLERIAEFNSFEALHRYMTDLT
jgi:acyl carrier protein